MKKIISNKKQFKKLIKKEKFQVFLFTSPLYIPFDFAVHSWIVTNNKGKINRWEVLQNKNLRKNCCDYIYSNFVFSSMGVNKYFWKYYPRNKSKIIGYLEGEENSLAEKIIKFVELEFRKYPLRKKYSYYPGPNSNTFTQWVINNFPKSNWKLPWNAFGKKYKK